MGVYDIKQIHFRRERNFHLLLVDIFIVEVTQCILTYTFLSLRKASTLALLISYNYNHLINPVTSDFKQKNKHKNV